VYIYIYIYIYIYDISSLRVNGALTYVAVERRPSPSSAEVKRKGRVIPLVPLWSFVACSRVTFTFTFFGETPGDDDDASYFLSYEYVCNVQYIEHILM